MSGGEDIIASGVGKLAAAVPLPMLRLLAHVLREGEGCGWPALRTKAVQVISHAHYRGLVVGFLNLWQAHAASVRPGAVSLALLTAAHSERTHRDGPSVELVWTGPGTDVVSFRRTEQALLQVIGSATRRVLVVSYAVYNIPRISEALVRAADRGVALKVIVETPSREEGQDAYDTLKALGPAVAGRSRVFLWPHERRPKGPGGKSGILHVKCAVADGRWLFLSSANLTEYAFTLNMELGLLVTGGRLPGQVEVHFDHLISTGVLARV